MKNLRRWFANLTPYERRLVDGIVLKVVWIVGGLTFVGLVLVS